MKSCTPISLQILWIKNSTIAIQKGSAKRRSLSVFWVLYGVLSFRDNKISSGILWLHTESAVDQPPESMRGW